MSAISKTSLIRTLDRKSVGRSKKLKKPWSNPNKWHRRVKMKKLQTEMTDLKNLVGKMKNSLESIISRVTVVIYRLSEMEKQLHNTSTEIKMKSFLKEND